MKTIINTTNQDNKKEVVRISLTYDQGFSKPTMSAEIEYKTQNISESNKIDIPANKDNLDNLIKTIQHINTTVTNTKTENEFLSHSEHMESITVKWNMFDSSVSYVCIDITRPRKLYQWCKNTKYIYLDNPLQIKRIKDILYSFIEQITNKTNNGIREQT